MRPEGRDAAYLWDVLDRARLILQFVGDADFHQYVQDKKLQLAIERALEIIGEAARRVSDTFRTAHPEVPWRRIIGQRNILAHEYGEIKQEVIWLVVTKHIPELIEMLERLDLPAPPPDPEPGRK